MWIESSFDSVYMPAHMFPCLWCLWVSIHFGPKSMILLDQLVSVWPEVLFFWDCSLMRHCNSPLHTHTQFNAMLHPHTAGWSYTLHMPWCRCLQHWILISHGVQLQPCLPFFIHYEVDVLKLFTTTGAMRHKLMLQTETLPMHHFREGAQAELLLFK